MCTSIFVLAQNTDVRDQVDITLVLIENNLLSRFVKIMLLSSLLKRFADSRIVVDLDTHLQQ